MGADMEKMSTRKQLIFDIKNEEKEIERIIATLKWSRGDEDARAYDLCRIERWFIDNPLDPIYKKIHEFANDLDKKKLENEIEELQNKINENDRSADLLRKSIEKNEADLLIMKNELEDDKDRFCVREKTYSDDLKGANEEISIIQSEIDSLQRQKCETEDSLEKIFALAFGKKKSLCESLEGINKDIISAQKKIEELLKRSDSLQEIQNGF